jgi:hypothetical protein
MLLVDVGFEVALIEFCLDAVPVVEDIFQREGAEPVLEIVAFNASFDIAVTFDD